MRMILMSLLFLSFWMCVSSHAQAQQETSLYYFSAEDIYGEMTSLSRYRGQAVLIVNTASRCGFTPQYRSLEQLYQKFKNRGFVVLAFPANNFLSQEPGTNEEIKNFCSLTYNVSFPLFAKISVKGQDQHPLFSFLTQAKGFEGEVGWNFTKFLIDRQGRVVGRFSSPVDPLSEEIIQAIERIL